MVTLWVVNASPVILLGKTGQLELLRHLGPTVIPDAAVREIQARGVADLAVQALVRATWLTRVAPGLIPAAVMEFGLGDGETAVLAHALANPGSGAIFDDQGARRYATALGISHRGTLGVVISAKVNGIIPLARPLVEQLRQSGMYLSDRVMDRALAQVGE